VTPETACGPDSPHTCACDDDGCTPLTPPYSTNPSAGCNVVLHDREISVLFGLVPLGAYHTWAVSFVRATPYHADGEEIFDGGPRGNCAINCGKLGAWASLPPQGYESGDLAGGGGFYSTGTSYDQTEGPDDICLSVQEIQIYIAGFSGQSNYNPAYGPNSNSVTYSLGIAGGLDQVPNHPMPKTQMQLGFIAPGWAMLTF
jgi:hypothetical protein